MRLRLIVIHLEENNKLVPLSVKIHNHFLSGFMKDPVYSLGGGGRSLTPWIVVSDRNGQGKLHTVLVKSDQKAVVSEKKTHKKQKKTRKVH